MYEGFRRYEIFSPVFLVRALYIDPFTSAPILFVKYTDSASAAFMPITLFTAGVVLIVVGPFDPLHKRHVRKRFLRKVNLQEVTFSFPFSYFHISLL